MAAGDLYFRFLLSALAVWRVTHLVVYEDGPWEVLARLRRRLGSGFWSSLVDCHYCLSLWVAAPVTLVFKPSLAEYPLVWLALSGAACLLERAAPDRIEIQPLPNMKGESIHAVLREERDAWPESAPIDHREHSS
jgi:hypothetical protein